MKTTKRIEEIEDVPTDELEELTRDFEAAGGVVMAIRQDNKLWTLSATFITSSE